MINALTFLILLSSCPMHAQHMAAAKSDAVRADGSADHGRHVDGRHDTFGMSERVDGGGRIRITTKSAEALAAIHAFLRFQVIEHRTANTGNVEEDD